MADWLPYVAVAAAYAVASQIAFGSSAQEDRLTWGAARRFWAEEYRVRYLLTPFGGVAGWPGRTAGDPGGAGHLLTGLVMGVALALLLLLLADRRRLGNVVPGILYFSLVWHVVTVLPLVVTYPAARHLYLPSAGVAMALGWALFPAARPKTPLTPARLVAGLGILLAYGTTLARYNREWAEAGTVSRAVRQTLERLARDLPAGSPVVVAGLPGSSNADRIRIWRWALPYALQRPITSSDAYAQLRILEAPGLSCCPLDQWWAWKRPIVARLMAGDDAGPRPVYSVTWRAGARDVACSKALIGSRSVRAIVRETLPGGLEFDGLDPQIADRFVRRLARTAQADPQGSCPVP